MSHGDVQTAYDRLQLVSDLTSAIAASSDVGSALTSTLRVLCDAGGWAVGQVWAPDGEDAQMRCTQTWHAGARRFEEFHRASAAEAFRRGEPFIGQVWENRRATWLPDLEDPRSFRRAAAAAAAGLQSALVVPVVTRGRVRVLLEFLACERRTQGDGLLEAMTAGADALGSLIAREDAEAELRRSEARFRAVADTAADAIITIDTSGCIGYVNRGVRDLLGYPPEELIGADVTVLVPERYQDKHRAGLSRYLSTGESFLIGTTTLVPARRRDGTEVPTELALSTWRVGSERYFTAILRDVSERERTRAALHDALAAERDASRRLRELADVRTTFLDAVSHDLRSPLASIRAAAQVLASDSVSSGLSEERRRRLVEGLVTSAQKMTALLDDLLDLERLRSGDVLLSRSPVRLDDLVARCVEEHRLALGGRTVTIALEPVTADVDAAKVERIVENLLLNAARHTPATSRVQVSVHRVGSDALIRCDDDGPGVPEHLRHEVFQRFRQAPGRASGGSGIGLSLVARLAELHGGSASVEESRWGGASFRVQVPCHPEQDEPSGGVAS